MRGQINSWTIERDGITYRVDLDPDQESNPRDADCYSPSDVAAFDRGEWEYVGVTVTPQIGQATGAVSVSLWGVEYGTMPAEVEPWQGGTHGRTEITDASIEKYPVPDLISEARGELREFRDSIAGELAGLSLDDCPATHLRTEGIPAPFTVHCERAAGHPMPHRVMDYEWTG